MYLYKTFQKPALLTLTLLTLTLQILALSLLVFSKAIAAQSDDAIKHPDIGATESILFSGEHKAPWQPFVGSKENWMVGVYGPSGSTQDSKKVTVRTLQDPQTGSALQVEWQGGEGHFLWQGQQGARDFSTFAEQQGAISMVLRVDNKPKKDVELKMDCGYPCAGVMNMTKLFKSLPQGQWVRISVMADCFKKAGAELNKIQAPLLLSTKGSFMLSFADVRLINNPPENSLAKCD